MLSSFSNLRDKEVVNIKDGKRLGCIADLVLDIPTGRICRIVLPPVGKLVVFSSKDNISIPWDCIEKIGDDVILVRYTELPSKKK